MIHTYSDEQLTIILNLILGNSTIIQNSCKQFLCRFDDIDSISALPFNTINLCVVRAYRRLPPVLYIGRNEEQALSETSIKNFQKFKKND